MKKQDIQRSGAMRGRRSQPLVIGLLLASSSVHLITASAAELTVPVMQSPVHETTFEYDAITGLLKKKTEQPDGSDSQKLVTEYDYDKGNPSKESRTGWAGQVPGQQTRRSGTTWTIDGRFPSDRMNALDQKEQVEFDPAFGGMTVRVDPNGWVTRWEYDGLGRKRFERRGYANRESSAYTDYTEWTYEACSSGCSFQSGPRVAMIVTATVRSSAGVQIGPATKTYFDRLNREVRRETQTLDGNGALATVYKDTVHDRRGNVWLVSQPYFSTSSYIWTYSETDDLGRRTLEQTPNNAVTRISYDGLDTITRVNVRGVDRIRTSTADLRGRPTSTTDARGNVTGFLYDPQGGLSRVLGPYGDVVAVEYDALGRKVSQKDPDLGDWSYEYNAFGEVVSQRNALGKTSKMTYDKLGRLTLREDGDLTTTFVYDTAAGGIGKLSKVYTDNGYCREHGYDAQSRPTTTVMKVGGNACANATESLTARTDYDAYGRIETQTYPTGFSVTYGRHPTLGLPIKVTSAQMGGATLWTRDGGDEGGRPTAFSYGNGVKTSVTYNSVGMGWVDRIAAGANNAVQFSKYSRDQIGQIIEREDSFDLPSGLLETTDVDELGRLKAYYRKSLLDQTQVAGSRVDVTYDAVGRIVSKTDVGTYFYAQPDGKRPHAVTAVRGAVNVDYDYDAAGQMTVRNFADNLYTNAGLLRMAGAARKCHEFLYQGEGLRVQQTIFDSRCRQSNGQPQNGSYPLARTLYMHPDASNGLSFERETKGGATQYKHYVEADGRPIAEIVSTTGTVSNGTPVAVNYLHYDHLGSVVAVTNANGAVLERRSFDPWGRVRQTNGTAAAGGDLPGGINAATDRGYTLHEHLEGLDLIHMNGRAYDPLLARFTSGDPNIASAHEGQSYDRYAYVLNRPLDAADPTGFDPVGYTFAFQVQATGGSTTGINVGAAVSSPWGSVPTATSAGNGQTVGAAQYSNSTWSTPSYPMAMEATGIKFLTSTISGWVQDFRNITDPDMFRRFVGEIDARGYGKELLRGALDRFVKNNQPDSPDSNFYTRFLARQVEGTYTPPDSASANGVAAEVSAAAFSMFLQRGRPSGEVVAKDLGRFSVGRYDELVGAVKGLDAHHVGQKALMKELIPGYDPLSAPSILVPKAGHTIRGPNGIVSRSMDGLTTPRDVLARDIKELRRVYPEVPNSQLQQLIRMNKDAYPGSF